MSSRENAVWFAVTVITKLALDTVNTVADTAKKRGVVSIVVNAWS